MSAISKSLSANGGDCLFNLHLDIQTLITTSTTTLVAIGGLWVTLSKNHREAKKDKLESDEYLKSLVDGIACLKSSVDEIKEQNESQQIDIMRTKAVTDSFFRMSLYNSLTKALKRGHTTVSEATEITKLYIAYRDNGGNGEIKLLYGHFEELPIKEDSFEIK